MSKILDKLRKEYDQSSKDTRAPYVEDWDEFTFLSPIGDEVYWSPTKGVLPISNQKLEATGFTPDQIKQIHQRGGLCFFQGELLFFTKEALQKLEDFTHLPSTVNTKIATSVEDNSKLIVPLEFATYAMMEEHDIRLHIAHPNGAGGIVRNVSTQENNFLDENGSPKYWEIFEAVLTAFQKQYPMSQVLSGRHQGTSFFVELSLSALAPQNFQKDAKLIPTLEIWWDMEAEQSFKVSGALYSPTLGVAVPVTKPMTYEARSKSTPQEFGQSVASSLMVYEVMDIMNRLLSKDETYKCLRPELKEIKAEMRAETTQSFFDYAAKCAKSHGLYLPVKKEPQWHAYLNLLYVTIYMAYNPTWNKSGKTCNLASRLSKIHKASRLWGEVLMS